MKKALKSFHQEVMAIVRKYWPKLVANELVKLSGGKPLKAPKIEVTKIKASKPKPEPAQVSSVDFKDPMTYIDALTKHGTKIKAAESLGLAETTFRDRYNKAVSDQQKVQAAAS